MLLLSLFPLPMTYLDHAAGTPLDPQVFEDMKPWFTESFGNPSSLSRSGQAARAAVDQSRMAIASYLGCEPQEVLFTASGTESCNWALWGVVEQRLLKGESVHVIVSAIEHSAVLKTIRFLQKAYGIRVTELEVDEDGIIDMNALRSAFCEDTALVSVMMVNNEIGTLQPVKEIGELCKSLGVIFHTDACQAPLYFNLDVNDLSVDLLTMNATKIYGPQGVGLLYKRDSIEINSWTFGGAQEFGMRAGTENVAGIVGFGKAVELLDSRKTERESIQKLRDDLWKSLEEKITGLHLNGSAEQRSPNNLNFCVEGVSGETLVKRMDLQGYEFSTGSACSSGRVEPSHVILALGKDEEAAQSSIRISLGYQNTAEELEEFAQTLHDVVSDLRNS